MCGITGYISNSPEHDQPEVIKRMLSLIEHRGPDDQGSWKSEDKAITLGHTRLSILDLSSAGRQPMLSENQRYAISYNGEVYNFREIREKLERKDHHFQTTTDTEVILAAFEEWGIDCCQKFNGMFAMAIYDQKEKELYLVRDRLGIKPLYYGWAGRAFVFSSELAPIKSFPSFDNPVDRAVLKSYIRMGYIPAPQCIYKNCYKLLPGTWLKIPVSNTDLNSYSPFPEKEKTTFAPQYYWNPQKQIEDSGNLQPDFSYKEGRANLKNLLKDSVKMRLVSDVPLGCFLSGGIDSSLTTAIMSEISSSQIRTFSIGFEETAYNEAEHARKIADYLGTDHTELYVTEQDALDVVDKIPTMYSEPFSDSSQIPTFLLSKLTRKHVTVSLSGDGGDELFTGYERYIAAKNLWNVSSKLPVPLKKLALLGFDNIPDNLLPLFLKPFTRIIPKHLHSKASGSLYRKGLQTGLSSSRALLYHNQISHQYNPDSFVISEEKENFYPFLSQDFRLPTDTEYFQYLDLITYLPDDILCKVDRASMAVALEARVPILDHRIVEYAWKVPLKYKLQGYEPKVILKDILADYLPRELFMRPKQGFSIPVREWLKGELRDWAEDLLSVEKLSENDYFYPGPIRKMWGEHLADKYDWSQQLWTVLTFQKWLQS